MSSLDDARRKIEERRAAQPTGGSNTDLWFRKDDIAIAHHMSHLSPGQDEPYFEVYVVHEYPATGQGKYPTKKYCPVESGHDGNYDCAGCRDSIKTKDQVIMWFWVYNILHANLTEKDGQLDQVNWNGKTYFNREVNKPLLWDTSAWRESPLDDILMLAAQLGDLHKTRVNLAASGENLTRRYKHYMEPGSPEFDEDLFEEGKKVITPVIEILRSRLVTMPTQANPANATILDFGKGAGSPAVPAVVKPFTPAGGASSVPALKVPAKPEPINIKGASTGKKLF